MDLAGEAVGIHFSGDSSGQGSLCQFGVPCLLRQSGVAGNPSDFVSISGDYRGRGVDARGPASGAFDFVSMWTFGAGSATGPLSVPIDVSGRMLLTFPAASGPVELSVLGRGTVDVFVEKAAQSDALGVHFGLAKFSGALVETPEPSTAMLLAAGLGGLLVGRRLRK